MAGPSVSVRTSWNRNLTQLRDYNSQELQYRSVIGPFPHNSFSMDCVISPLQCVPPGHSVNDRIMCGEYPCDLFRLCVYYVCLGLTDKPSSFIVRVRHDVSGLKKTKTRIQTNSCGPSWLSPSWHDNWWFILFLYLDALRLTLCHPSMPTFHWGRRSHSQYWRNCSGRVHPSIACPNFLRSSCCSFVLKRTPLPYTRFPFRACVSIHWWWNFLFPISAYENYTISSLSSWLAKTQYSKRELQQLLGKLAFVTSWIRPGRAFSCHLISALRSCFASPRHRLFPVCDDMGADLVWWNFSLSMQYSLMLPCPIQSSLHALLVSMRVLRFV